MEKNMESKVETGSRDLGFSVPVRILRNSYRL